MQRDRAQVDHVPKRREVINDEIVDLAVSVFGINPFRADPVGNKLWSVFLKE
jgi:hypothetical protein